MSALLRRAGGLVALALVGLAQPGSNADTANVAPMQRGLLVQATKVDINNLSMEVLALQDLDTLQATADQLKALAKLAGETAAKARARKPAVVSEKYKKKLTDLRAALVKRDMEVIQILNEELGILQATEKSVVDNTVDISDPARRRVAEVLKTFSPRQIAVYLATFESRLQDPCEGMYLALENGAVPLPPEWKELRDSVSQEIVGLLAGVDVKQTAKVNERVTALLDKGHKIKEADLPKSRPDLEKEMKQIVGTVGAMEMLHHFMERQIALLLSNPQLAVAVDAQLKSMK